MTSIVRRTLAVSATAVTLAAGASVLSAGMASAAALGTLTINPGATNVTTPFSLTTAGACPAGTDHVGATIAHTGWKAAYDLVSVTDNGFSTTGPMSLPAGDNLAGVANGNGETVTPGEYDVVVNCVGNGGLGAAVPAYEGFFWVGSDSAKYSSLDPSAPASTTSLAATPNKPTTDDVVTLTATVTNGAAGAVQFKDGSANLGSPVPLTAGQAVWTGKLPAAAHSLSAVYSGVQQPNQKGGVQGSTSSALPLSVAAPATVTTTSLAAPASAPSAYQATSFPVTVMPAAAAGTVSLSENGVTLGSAPADPSGTTAIPVTFTTQGVHNLIATFTPTDPAAYKSSSSAPVATTVGAPAGVQASQTIETTVDAGSLTISVDDNPTVVLPNPVLDQSAGMLRTTGKINTVTVTDTRAGGPGFTVSGLLGDFNGSGGKINAANLGWTPSVKDASSGLAVTPGSSVDPAAGLAVGASGGQLGLGAPRVLAVAAPASATGGGVGTTHLNAAIALNVPTNTPAGKYDATLTLTAI